MSYAGVYALYENDKIIAIGTVKEIAKELGLQVQSVQNYRHPSVRLRTNRKLILIKEQPFYGFDEVDVKKIKRLRHEFDYSLAEMGDIIEKHWQTYQNKEQKKSRFLHSEIEEIADLFFVDAIDLLVEEARDEED